MNATSKGLPILKFGDYCWLSNLSQATQLMRNKAETPYKVADQFFSTTSPASLALILTISFLVKESTSSTKKSSLLLV